MTPEPQQEYIIDEDIANKVCFALVTCGENRLANKLCSRPHTPETCTWKLDEEYQMYETGCGNAFECMEGDIEENNFKFCPYCGGKIVGGTP